MRALSLAVLAFVAAVLLGMAFMGALRWVGR